MSKLPEFFWIAAGYALLILAVCLGVGGCSFLMNQ